MRASTCKSQGVSSLQQIERIPVLVIAWGYLYEWGSVQLWVSYQIILALYVNRRLKHNYPHLFFNCEIVRKFWEEVVRHLHLIEIGLGSWDEIFLGLLGKSSRVNLCNTVIFFVEIYYFFCKVTGNDPIITKYVKIDSRL